MVLPGITDGAGIIAAGIKSGSVHHHGIRRRRTGVRHSAQAPGLRVSGGPIVQVAEDLTGQALDDRTGPELASLVDQVGLIARAPGDLVAPT